MRSESEQTFPQTGVSLLVWQLWVRGFTWLHRHSQQIHHLLKLKSLVNLRFQSCQTIYPEPTSLIAVLWSLALHSLGNQSDHDHHMTDGQEDRQESVPAEEEVS